MGSEAEIPWVRAFSREHAPSAQEGWYLAYLLSADGSAAYLALMQGVTRAGAGAFDAGAEWPGGLLGPQAGYDDPVDLESKQGPGSRPERYERAAVYAKRYDRRLLDQTQLREDLTRMVELLQQVYGVSGLTELEEDFSKLTLEAVLEAADDRRLRVSDSVAANLIAALRAGKHVLLTGPPGTGKTTRTGGCGGRGTCQAVRRRRPDDRDV